MRHLIALILLSTSCTVRAEITVERFPLDEKYQLPDIDPQQRADWLTAYLQFIEQQDLAGFALDYPKTAKDLRTEQPELRVRALRVCVASGDVRCIPLIVAQLRYPNRDVQVEAGLGLDRFVSEYELRRRDRSVGDRVEILPRREGDVDLRVLRPVLADMLRCGEPNLQAYAARMIGYLRLPELEPTLRAVHRSRHPATYRAVEDALSQLGLTYEKREE